MDYNFSQKRHWRRALWNSIAERVQVQRRDAFVVYLAGPIDADRPVAIDKGFSGRNLVAIERDKSVAKQLKDGGTFTLIGDIFKHLRAWHPDRRVDVCLLDLCGGLTPKIAGEIEDLMCLPQFQTAVFAINLLRGRDPQGNKLREKLVQVQNKLIDSAKNSQSKCVDLGIYSREVFDNKVSAALGGKPSLKRSQMMQTLITMKYALMVNIATGRLDTHGKVVISESEDQKRLSGVMLHSAIVNSMFQTLTYRSTANQTFDTLVFRNSYSRAGVTFHPSLAESVRNAPDLKKIKLHQAAVMAHRTRQIAA